MKYLHIEQNGVKKKKKLAIYFLLFLGCNLIIYSIRWLFCDTRTEYIPRLVTLKVDHVTTPVTKKTITEHSLGCYSSEENSTLSDINEETITPNGTIFFLETSCKSYVRGKLVLNARQACAVESAAKMNPNKSVYLLFTSPGNAKVKESDEYFKSLLSYKNIYLRSINVKKFVYGSPVENLFKHDLEESQFPIVHASDILRIFTLWKYGGTYMDLDVLTLKNWDNLTTNFIGKEADNDVANGIMSFSSDGPGHKLADMVVKELGSNFKPKAWSYNGPMALARMLLKFCNVTRVLDMTPQKCGGFTVYEPKIFYPIKWQEWMKYFDEDKLEEVRRASNESYALHVWNKLSHDKKVPVKSKMPYGIYAQEFCPKVYRECSTYF